MNRLEEETAAAVSELVAIDGPVASGILSLAMKTLSDVTALATILTMPGADRAHINRVIGGMAAEFLKPKPGAPLTNRYFRNGIAAYLRELADRLEA